MQAVDIYSRTAANGTETRTNLERQEAACRAYCVEHGLSVGAVHYEVSSGGTYRERERLGLIRARYREGSIQGVVVSTLDRLSRSQIHLIILMQEMEKYGASFHCASENIAETTSGKLISFVLGIISEVGREKGLDTSFTGPQL